MFSVRSFTSNAICAMRRIAAGCTSSVTPSVASSKVYCLTRLAWVLVRMASKSSTLSEPNSTRIGKRPCSSGIRSLGLLRWNAPEAMNSMWSVRTMPYLVLTVVPSTSGSKSRCTPWREMSEPLDSERDVTLSISSMKTMPFCSAFARATVLTSSSLTSLAASSSISSLTASAILTLRCFFLAPPAFANMPWSCSAMPSMPGGLMISNEAFGSATSSSISLSSSRPSRRRLRITWRAVLSAGGVDGISPKSALDAPEPRGDGTRMSSTRSSAASSARLRWRFMALSRSCLTAMSTRSRMIESTSLPT